MFEYDEARFRLGLLPGEALPDLALRMLAGGYDTQPIRELAGLVDPTIRDAGELFENALMAVRPDRMPVEKARRVVCKAILRQIVLGEIAPLKGADAISSQWNELGYPARLSVFVYLSDIYDELPDRRPAILKEIVDLAGSSWRKDLMSRLPNEALLLAAWDREAAGSLRSRAAIMIGRRSRAPRR